ncbi:MAG: nidogen-like domain-containing protein [Promethearchaeia archaeon]
MKKLSFLVIFGLIILSETIFLSAIFPRISPSRTNENNFTEKGITPKTSSLYIYDYHYKDIEHEWEELGDPFLIGTVNITDDFFDKDDDYTDTYLPFDFPFYDKKFNRIYISTNGYVSFNYSSPDEYDNPDFPIKDIEYSYVIAPFWTDLKISNISSIIIYNATSDKWVLEYKDICDPFDNYVGSFELVLYSNGIIQFNYDNISDYTESYTIGTNLGDGVHYYQCDLGNTIEELSFILRNNYEIFSEDFEPGGSWENEWSGIGNPNLWHTTSSDKHSGSYSLWCGNESTGTYAKSVQGTPVRVKENVVINNLDFRGYTEAFFSFWYKKITENSTTRDIVMISANIDGEQYFLNSKYVINRFPLMNLYWNISTWTYIKINVSFLCGFSQIDLNITFDTIDSQNNNYQGFKIDDIEIVGYKKSINKGSQLSISEGEEYTYYISEMNASKYKAIFKRDPFGSTQEKMRIKITKIDSYTSYWNITIKHWDFGKDFTNDADSQIKKFTVYKFPINIKSSFNFFIVGDDIFNYLQYADNINNNYTGNSYNILVRQDSQSGGYIYEMRFYYFRVELLFNDKGILISMSVYENEPFGTGKIYNLIYELAEGSSDEGTSGEEGEEKEKEEGGTTSQTAIPGYNINIIIASFAMIILFIMKKIFKKL